MTLRGSNLESNWTGNGTEPVSVWLNSYECRVTEATDTYIKCLTGRRNRGIFPPSLHVQIKGVGRAMVKPGARWRYLDRWSDLNTWANQEPPVDDDLVQLPSGQSVLLDVDTPRLLGLIVEGVLVWDDTRDLEMKATYIWVKGGTFEIGTEDKPFMHRATITLYGNKYEAIRLPVVGAKCLAVSNTQFTIRASGDGASEEGNIGTLDIHGAPRLKVWTRLQGTVYPGATVIVVQDDVDWKPGEEIMITATKASHKHVDGNGGVGAPPVDFQNERRFVASVGLDMRTVTLTAGLEFKHRSTSYTRPDGDFIDLSAEVALLSRNVRIQGDETSEAYIYIYIYTYICVCMYV